MVKILVKKGNETQFLYETSVETNNDELTNQITYIYNGRLKVSRICSELEELAKHGTMLPPDMMGLTDEQIEELKLKDEWGERCEPSGGSSFNKDPMGRRNGKQPSEKMQELIKKSVADVKEMLSKKKADTGVCMTLKVVQEALEILRGTVMIIYPMNLPPHDAIRQEFENSEDLSGTQASLDVIDLSLAQLWFTGKELLKNKKLCNFVGTNEKTKIVVKLSKAGEGAPAREPVVSEEERKQMMLHAYRRQEELKVRYTSLIIIDFIYWTLIEEFVSYCLEIFKSFQLIVTISQVY